MRVERIDEENVTAAAYNKPFLWRVKGAFFSIFGGPPENGLIATSAGSLI
jgi:hypothetical protein